MDTQVWLNLFMIVFLLFANGFFVAAEFALVGVRKTRMQQLSNEGNFSAKLALDALAHIDRYIAAVQLGITIASLGIGWVGEATLARLIHPIFDFLPGKWDDIAAHTISVTVVFAVITILHVVVGELMPKSIALQNPEKTTLWVSRPMYVITRIFHPMVLVLNGLGNFLLRLCKIDPNSSHSREHSPEELTMLVDASCRGGIIKKEEAEMIHNVFKFSDLHAIDIMVPRMNMVAIAIDEAPEDINTIIIDNQYTRYPVYEEDIDHIKGFLHVKDLYPLLVQGKPVELSKILRPALFIPETMPVDNLAQEFQKKHCQFAIVIDEFGGTSGLITYEDVMEEIFGEVQDEFDEEEDTSIKQLSENKYEVCGKMRIDEFCDFFNVKIPDDEDIHTIGGYFTKKLGKIACTNDEICDEYFKYCVTETDSARINKICVEKLNQE